MAESQRESGDSWKRVGSTVKVSFLQLAMRLNMLTEQGEQHSLSQDLRTSQGVKLATMHDHQEECSLFDITCSAVHCHKILDFQLLYHLTSTVQHHVTAADGFITATA